MKKFATTKDAFIAKIVGAKSNRTIKRSDKYEDAKLQRNKRENSSLRKPGPARRTEVFTFFDNFFMLNLVR